MVHNVTEANLTGVLDYARLWGSRGGTELTTDEAYVVGVALIALAGNGGCVQARCPTLSVM
jgi:hypothetical protein